MTRMQRSWALAKSSWAVLKSEKGLLWLPVLSFIGSVIVVGIFALAVWATLGKDTGSQGDTEYSANVVTYVLGFCTYIGVALVQTFFLAALCAGANERLQGRDTTIGMALGVAQSRLHRILPWALVSATVSIIIEAIEERFGFLGRIIAGLIGAAWNVVTFLTVPIIVFEDVGPVTALKRSGHLLKQTWGENLMAQIGLGAHRAHRVPARHPRDRARCRGRRRARDDPADRHRRRVPRGRRVDRLGAERDLPHRAVPVRGRRPGPAGIREHGHGARVRQAQGRRPRVLPGTTTRQPRR